MPVVSGHDHVVRQLQLCLGLPLLRLRHGRQLERQLGCLPASNRLLARSCLASSSVAIATAASVCTAAADTLATAALDSAACPWVSQSAIATTETDKPSIAAAPKACISHMAAAAPALATLAAATHTGTSRPSLPATLIAPYAATVAIAARTAYPTATVATAARTAATIATSVTAPLAFPVARPAKSIST